MTIADVKVDGKSLEGFSKTTIDLMAYQKGNTRKLGSFDMDAKTYSNITLILDYEQDEFGVSPGCYVKEEDGAKHNLTSSTSNELNLSYSFNNEAAVDNNLIIDFDLRKSIKRGTNGNSKYSFVSSAEMKNAVRIVSKDKAGVIKGNCVDSFSSSDMIVVYAYKKGSFNRNTEIQGSAQSGLNFHNAINSCKIEGNGNFELHFLEEGDYEIHFAAYGQNQNTGKMELSGTLLVEVLSSIELGSISVNASASITANVLVIGIIPI